MLNGDRRENGKKSICLKKPFCCKTSSNVGGKKEHPYSTRIAAMLQNNCCPFYCSLILAKKNNNHNFACAAHFFVH